MLQGIFEGLKEFVARDLIFIIGGGSVLAAFLYRFHSFPTGANDAMPVIFQILAVGIAYITGYLLQDAASMTGIITTASDPRPCYPTRWLYKRFTGENWPGHSHVNSDELRTALETLPLGSYTRGVHERHFTITMLSATMAPCSLVVSGLLFWKRFSVSMGSEFDLTLGIVALAASILFWILNRLKAAQLAVLEAHIIRQHTSNQHGKLTRMFRLIRDFLQQ